MTTKPDSNPDRNSLLGHLGELRQRLIKSLLAIGLGFGVAYYYSASILSFLVRPLMGVLPEGQTLIYTGLPDGFVATIKLGLWGGLLLAAPIWLYQFWAFIAPGLYQTEKKQAGWLAFSATILLALGTCFAYMVIFPLAFRFFIGFSGETISAMPALGAYLSLITTMLLAGGLVFQLPLVIIFLAKLGLIDSGLLIKSRKYAILMIFVAAAVITPPDVISQCLLALPMMALYEISLLLVAASEKKTAAVSAQPKIEFREFEK